MEAWIGTRLHYNKEHNNERTMTSSHMQQLFKMAKVNIKMQTNNR